MKRIKRMHTAEISVQCSKVERTVDKRLHILVERYIGLQEIPCDADGLYAGLIMPPEQHWILWICSWAAAGTASYATVRGMHDFAISTFTVCLTSLNNYWRKPRYYHKVYFAIITTSKSCTLIR